MDPVLANLIRDISFEGIKILGPAAIASIVAYKSASAQYKAKLAELTRQHEFNARQHLFDYYKQQAVSYTHLTLPTKA